MPAPINLDMDLLRAFAVVAEARSLTAGAGRLHRTQSTVRPGRRARRRCGWRSM
jgi:hypothetical protein